MKVGVIDVGGGSRDIFGAGVLDYCLDENINFDYCIGISAGSANLASYLAHQRGRNYVFYMDYFFRKEYASVRNFLKKRNYVDMDYVYGQLSAEGGEYPLDYKAMIENPAEFLIEACGADQAEPIFFGKNSIKQNKMEAFKASCSLPILCQPVNMNGIPCFDGGLADSVPVKKAFEDGCDKVVLILTRPKDEYRTPDADIRNAKLIRKHYPKIAEALENRTMVYNDSLSLARQWEKEGRVLIIAPESIEGLKTLTKDKEKLENLYCEGFKKAAKIKAFLS